VLRKSKASCDVGERAVKTWVGRPSTLSIVGVLTSTGVGAVADAAARSEVPTIPTSGSYGFSPALASVDEPNAMSPYKSSINCYLYQRVCAKRVSSVDFMSDQVRDI